MRVIAKKQMTLRVINKNYGIEYEKALPQEFNAEFVEKFRTKYMDKECMKLIVTDWFLSQPGFYYRATFKQVERLDQRLS